ncbi:MAG: RDD family protein [archaeon]
MPFCASCGNELPPAAIYCPNCGAPVNYARPGEPASSVASVAPSNLADLGQRIVAAIVDIIILSLVVGLITAVSLILGLTLLPWSALGGMNLTIWRSAHPGTWIIVTLVPLVYYVCLEATSGQTLGKRLVHIKVVKANGMPCNIAAAILRNIVRIVVDNILFGLVGILLIAATKKRQRLGDILAGTIVVRF